MSKVMRWTSTRASRREALEALGLDAVYERGQGSRLWRRGVPEPVWDFLGGYGSTFFGHNHPALVDAARDFLDAQRVIHGQASVRTASDELAAALAARLRHSLRRDFRVLLASTGAEAIEIAAKHAEHALARRRGELRRLCERARAHIMGAAREHNGAVLARPPVHLAVFGSYHGMTARALSLTDGQELYFGHESGLNHVRFMDPDDPEAVDRVLDELKDVVVVPCRSGETGTLEEVTWSPVASLFVEPIRGEGGIHPLRADVARAWRSTCDRHGVPLVADEIQSGMGRTGTFLYAEQIGLDPNYVLVGKALGGGIAKVSAVCVRSEDFVPDFTMRHVSTFAEDEFSSHVALRALALLEEEDSLARAKERGQALIRRLRDLASRHPGVIRDVRGEGLMIGVEWCEQAYERSNLLHFLETHQWMGYARASYLLSEHGVRVAPALSEGATLRIEPAYSVPDAAVEALMAGLESLCRVIEDQDSALLIGPCIGVDAPARATRPERTRVLTAPRGAHVGFVGHLIDAEDFPLWDGPFARLEPGASSRLLDRVYPLVDPIVSFREVLRSADGSEVTLTFVGLAVPSSRFHAALRTPERHVLRLLVQRAVEVAAAEGCSVVGLGGYCSILTRNCKDLDAHGMALTTGNGYTVGAGLEAMRRAAAEVGIDWGRAHAAVVGAQGNIGSVCARLLAAEVRSLVLVGRPGRLDAAIELGRRIGAETGCRVDAACDLKACRDAALIVSASNEPGVVIQPEHIGHGPVVLNDLAVPADVAASVATARPRTVLIRGGIIRTPANPDWSVPGIPLAPGEMYACMAETALMGLEGVRAHGSLGALTSARVRETVEMARRHGFMSVRPKVRSSY